MWSQICNFQSRFMIGIFRYSYDNTLIWMSHDLTDVKSTLVQVMAWCRQATSHYLSQCWPRSVSPYGITRQQWVKLFMSQLDNAYLLISNWGLCPVFVYHQPNLTMLSLEFETLRLEQNGWHNADNIWKCIFLNENINILIHILSKFVSTGPVNSKSALVSIIV